jgi:nitrogen fixation/metabolism regulation signal transduction histidine kinase
MHNLLQNAQDALLSVPATVWGQQADRMQPTITIRTETVMLTANDGLQHAAVRLTLSDNGTGFAPQILSKAFEPYITTKSSGTGLGLAIVRKIIDEHGAHISLSNLEQKVALAPVTDAIATPTASPITAHQGIEQVVERVELSSPQRSEIVGAMISIAFFNLVNT